MKAYGIRVANRDDIERIRSIYNQGIEDRIATLESEIKDSAYMENWFDGHQGRQEVIVAESAGFVIGWAALSPYSHRCADRGVAELSVYVDRAHRGKGAGSALLAGIEEEPAVSRFRKIVLFLYPFNTAAQSLYPNTGYREVGVFKNHGMLDGRLVDLMIMEKELPPNR